MARATWVLGATSLAGASLALWLYLDNRALRAQIDSRSAAAPIAAPTPATPAAAPSPWAPRTVAIARTTAVPAPALPEPSADSETRSRMERRAHRTDEFAAMFGRLDGESDAEYRARILPMITAGAKRPTGTTETQSGL